MVTTKRRSSSGIAGKIFTEGKRAAAFIAADKIFEKLVSTAGEKLIEGINVKLFGMGPNDEALYNEVKASLDQTEKMCLAKFIKRMKQEGYSFWWFRNVIATMQENFNKTSKEKDVIESSAFKILDAILSESNWEDQVEIAGPSLLIRSFKKRADDFWEIVKVGGEKIIIFPKDKLSQIDWQTISDVIECGADDFAQGFKNPVRGRKTIGIWISLIIGGIFIAVIIIAAITITM